MFKKVTRDNECLNNESVGKSTKLFSNEHSLEKNRIVLLIGTP